MYGCCYSDVDFFASMRYPTLLKMRQCNSTSYHSDVTSDMPTTPMSCDSVTLMSLPSFHSTHHSATAGNSIPIPGSSRHRGDKQMSTGFLGINESWSSFSSLHSLPEPFLCRNHNDSASRGILNTSLGNPDINGWHESRDGGSRGALPLLVNGYASAEPRLKYVFHRPSNGPTSYSPSRSNDSGTLRASSIGHEIDSVGFGDESRKNSTKTPTLSHCDKPATVRSSSARPANAVLGHLMRAKSVTSKTFRKFGPKFAGPTKSVDSREPGSSNVKNAIVHRSSSIAQRFKAFRNQSVESHLGVGSAEGKTGPYSLRRVRERSPLASESPGGHVPHSVNSVVAGTKSNVDAPITGRDPLRRVLFGTAALKDGQKISETSKARLSFHGRNRTVSYGDEMMSGSNIVPAARPRSTEPQSKSIRIEPSSYQINISSPLMMETQRSAADASFTPLAVRSSYSPHQFIRTLPATTSPRMASPESSSLSSGSLASVFSAVPPSDNFRQSSPPLPPTALESAPSMSDLSLWEMPKLDIDLIDEMFIGPGRGTEPDVVTQTCAALPPLPKLTPTSQCDINAASDTSSHLDPPAVSAADIMSGSTHYGSKKPFHLVRNISDSVTTKTQDQTANISRCGLTLTMSEPPESTSSPIISGGARTVSMSDGKQSSSNCVSSGSDCGNPNDCCRNPDDGCVLVAKDLERPTSFMLDAAEPSQV